MGSDYLYQIADQFTGLSGIKAVYCGDGDGADVKPLPDVLETPCIVVVDGEQSITAASWERQTMQPEARVYVSRQGRGLGQAYETARSYKTALLAAVRDSSGVTGVTSFVPLRFRPVEDTEWPAASGNWYFVLALECEAKLSHAVTYTAPQ